MEGWTPGIGDPTLLGWVTVGAYLAAAWLAALARTRARKPFDRSFWLFAAALLLALAINKQLDLQSLLTAIVRTQAKAHGWYESRRIVQTDFVYAIALLAAILGFVLVRMARRSDRFVRMAILGLAFICAFVLIRASSFHHVSTFLNDGPAGVRWNWILEIGGIAIVAVAAHRYPRRSRRSAARPRR